MKSLSLLISTLAMVLSFSACAHHHMPKGAGVCNNPKCKCPKPCQCGSACKCGMNGNPVDMDGKK